MAVFLTKNAPGLRTSPVKRGYWIVHRVLGQEIPPPPPVVPQLPQDESTSDLPIRDMLARHRANPVCASCHTKMDPLGFSLENYDAVGAWRNGYAGQVVDASAVLPDGTQFEGPRGLQGILLARKVNRAVDAKFPDNTESNWKLGVYAVGRATQIRRMRAPRPQVERGATVA